MQTKLVAALCVLPLAVLAAVPALDLSSPKGTAVWTCVQKQGFVKAVPRLYREACGVNTSY